MKYEIKAEGQKRGINPKPTTPPPPPPPPPPPQKPQQQSPTNR